MKNKIKIAFESYKNGINWSNFFVLYFVFGLCSLSKGFGWFGFIEFNLSCLIISILYSAYLEKDIEIEDKEELYVDAELIEETIIEKEDKKEKVSKEEMLSELLLKGYLFANCYRFLDHIRNGKDELKIVGKTTALFVNCNDLFYWGCSDAEDLPENEIENLYKMYLKDNSGGVDKWCCKQRNMQPQEPIKKRMIADGIWDDMMESLPLNDGDFPENN